LVVGIHIYEMFNMVDWVNFGHIYLELGKAQNPTKETSNPYNEFLFLSEHK
jgi:hypothetical protein